MGLGWQPVGVARFHDDIPRALVGVQPAHVIRLRSLAMGVSGTRPAVAEALAALLNGGVTPVVPSHGSLGASGDLAPLAHVALGMFCDMN